MKVDQIRNKLYNIYEGTILWYSEKDGNGIIKDNEGNEYYFDDSTIKVFEKKISNGDFVIFKPEYIDNEELLISGKTLLLDLESYLAYHIIFYKIDAYYCYHDEGDWHIRDILNDLMDFIDEEKAGLIKVFNLKASKMKYQEEGGGYETMDKFIYQTLVVNGLRSRLELILLIKNIKSFLKKSDKNNSKKFFQFLGIEQL